MPFTFSHPAIMLPLYKVKWFSLTGLVIGSVTPDFEYYIRMEDKRIYTHTWSGLLWYDLPLAILLAFIFHNVVRNSLINNSPVWLQKRLIRYKNYNWNARFKKNWLIIIFSILIGGSSHLLWDGFTHEDGDFAKKMPFLINTIRLGNFNIEGWMIAQILSSLLGLLIIFYSIWQLPPNKQSIVNTRVSNYWITMISITLLIYTVKMFLGTNDKMENSIIPFISGFLAALILTPLLLKYSHLQQKTG